MEWRIVEEFPNYEVSENGQIRNRTTGHIKSQRIKNNGYVITDLSRNGEVKTVHIHRIVAKAFLPNPQNYSEVNHINEDKTDNYYGNLEWCDRTYNNNYGNIQTLRLNTLKSRQSSNAPQRVQQIDKDGNIIATYPSMREAERQTGINNTRISAVCRGESKQAGGYIWKKAPQG